jgi:hypothetical protein
LTSHSLLGVKLKPATIVVLMLDGTLVFVEDVQPAFASVVALPEQPPERNPESYVLIPGRVGAKKISPYSEPSDTIALEDLSERNREFLASFLTLRKLHGPKFVDQTPEEAAMSVRKAGPAPRMALTPEERAARKEERRALKKKCATCGAPKSKHDGGTGHEFTPKAGRVKRERAKGGSIKSGRFRLVSEDLAALQAANDKWKPGNRFHRVFLALQALQRAAGTDESGASFEDVVSSVERDGLRAMTDAAKVTRRALKQLAAAGIVARL